MDRLIQHEPEFDYVLHENCLGDVVNSRGRWKALNGYVTK